MSVINQMLRDLDQRGQTPETPALGTALQQGTHRVLEPARPVHVARSSRRSAPWVLLAGVGGLGTVAALGAWYLGYLALPGVPERPLPVVVATAPALPSSAAAPAPAQPGSDAASPMAVATNASTMAVSELPVSLRLEAQLEHAPVPAPEPASVAPPVTVVKQKPATLPAARTEVAAPKPQAMVPPAPVAKAEKSPPSVAPIAATAPAATAAPTVAEATPQVQQRQGAAARDALAQAQSLWNAGNPAAATDLLREAVQVALRSTPASAPLDGTQAAMVRELARMQMGSGHVAEAHALLVQTEARIHAHAELWAMRANAAQRLGQHQDSVQSYMQALQYRPNEQRWLLGMAVSLAAMGQTGAANGVVERARNEGAIPREIADYLRQMGVVVK